MRKFTYCLIKISLEACDIEAIHPIQDRNTVRKCHTIIIIIIMITRKRFSEKPIVAVTNRTVFVLDLLSLFGLMFWPLDSEVSSYSQFPGSLTICMQGK